AALENVEGLHRGRQEEPGWNHLQLVGPLRRAAHSDGAVRARSRGTQDAPPADRWRRTGADSAARQQFASARLLDLGVDGADQGRQGAPARLLRWLALEGAARRADHEGARL